MPRPAAIALPILGLLLFGLVACRESAPTATRPPVVRPSNPPKVAPRSPETPQNGPRPPNMAAGKAEAPKTPPAGMDLVVAKATQGPLAPVIQAALATATRDGRRLLVYVGATWCDPCRRFHDAVLSGALNDAFPTLRLLAFDRDRDNARLEAAGYSSRYIPLFAVPAASGRYGGRQIEGSVKGSGAVANITPRLKRLLAAP